MTPPFITNQRTERGYWSIAVFAFGIALIFLAFALYILAAPHGLVIGPRDRSLAERLIVPLIIAAFPCCAVAPLFSKRRLKEQLLFSVCAVAAAVAVVVAGILALQVAYGASL